MTYVRLVMHAPYIFNIFKSGQRSRVLQIGLGGGVSGAFLEWLPEKVISILLKILIYMRVFLARHYNSGIRAHSYTYR